MLMFTPLEAVQTAKVIIGLFLSYLTKEQNVYLLWKNTGVTHFDLVIKDAINEALTFTSTTL